MYIETERLILRPHTPDDFEDYFGYIMEPELQRMLGLNGVEDRESALETFQWLLDAGHGEFLAVVSRETGRVIGHICAQRPLKKLADDPGFAGRKGASLSFAIARWERRKGLMQEALEALIGKLDSLPLYPLPGRRSLDGSVTLKGYAVWSFYFRINGENAEVSVIVTNRGEVSVGKRVFETRTEDLEALLKGISAE